MPSRPLLPPPLPPPPSHTPHHYTPTLLLPLAISLGALFLLLALLLLFLLYLYKTLHRSCPTLPFSTSPLAVSPTPPHPPHLRRYSPRLLRRATNNFHPSTSLGRGASASVFHAVLPPTKSVAVKRFHSATPAEFHHEIRLFSSGIMPSSSPFIVHLLGYSVDKRKKQKFLVYEYLSNGSLQEALFSSSVASEKRNLNWSQRFNIILDVAQGIAFLHRECHPPVVHGDVKPSNVLLGSDFRAKISDFGLSRIKDYQGYAAEHELLGTPVESVAAPSNCSDNFCGGCSTTKESNQDDDLFSIDHSSTNNSNGFSFSGPVSSPAEDDHGPDANRPTTNWWWRQDCNGELCARDYVSEWIGNQIRSTEVRNDDHESTSSPAQNLSSPTGIKQFECEDRDGKFDCEVFQQDVDVDVDNGNVDNNKNKKMREWWKEERFAEINEKKEKKTMVSKRRYHKRLRCFVGATRRSQKEEDSGDAKELEEEDFSFRKGWRKKKGTRSAGSEMYSEELFSRELSSTTSMRGTVCYVAPESGNPGTGHLMEKADIYSFGMLTLVIVSGRRPLHVLSSPLKLEKANLVRWCRQLARAGNELDLVDETLMGEFDAEQARLCIRLALLCLQRSPDFRPQIGDVVGILKGEMRLPEVDPAEFSRSPPTRSAGGRARRKRKPKVEC